MLVSSVHVSSASVCIAKRTSKGKWTYFNTHLQDIACLPRRCRSQPSTAHTHTKESTQSAKHTPSRLSVSFARKLPSVCVVVCGCVCVCGCVWMCVSVCDVWGPTAPCDEDTSASHGGLGKTPPRPLTCNVAAAGNVAGQCHLSRPHIEGTHAAVHTSIHVASRHVLGPCRGAVGQNSGKQQQQQYDLHRGWWI